MTKHMQDGIQSWTTEYVKQLHTDTSEAHDAIVI